MSLAAITNTYAPVWTVCMTIYDHAGLRSKRSQPNDSHTDFVRNLNLLVDETTALYNLRIGASKAGKKRGNDRQDEV